MGTKVLDTLNAANQTLVLATEVGGVLIPIVKGIATMVRESTEGGSITYTVAITTGIQNLDDADAAYRDVISMVNAERAKAHLPPLEMP
jgi:hypothetical protein